MKIYPILGIILLQISNNICEGSVTTTCNETCKMCCMTDDIWTCCNFSELLNDAISSERFQKLLKNGQIPEFTEKTPIYNSLKPAAFGFGAVLGVAFGALAFFICCGIAIHTCCHMPQQDYMSSFMHRIRSRDRTYFVTMESSGVIHINVSPPATTIYHSHCEDEHACPLTDMPPKYEDLSKTLVTNDNEITPNCETLPTYSSLSLST